MTNKFIALATSPKWVFLSACFLLAGSLIAIHRASSRVAYDESNAMLFTETLRKALTTPELAKNVNWKELETQLDLALGSDDYCERRNAFVRASGLLAGLHTSVVHQPAYAATTLRVSLGSDSGFLVMVPAEATICAGDTVMWTNNQVGPHSVVFDEDTVPDGVKTERISMEEGEILEEGDTFSVTLDAKGVYEYYCLAHRGAGMTGRLVVQ